MCSAYLWVVIDLDGGGGGGGREGNQLASVMKIIVVHLLIRRSIEIGFDPLNCTSKISEVV